VEFSVLGPLSVRIDGTPVALGGAKQRALLAMLLLRANAVVSRDSLIDGLWGEHAPATADRSLDSHISRLRRLLGPKRIERRAPGYLLNVDPGELDLDRFETLLEQGRALARSGENAAAAHTLGEALAIWNGSALADLLFEPFAVREADRLEERRLLAFEERVDADLALGKAEDLVGELEQAVGEHPHREGLVGQLMLALYRTGRQRDALAVYQALRRHLSEDLGLEPSPQLRDLERRILQQDPTLAARRVERPAVRRNRRKVVALACVGVAVVVSAVIGIELGTGGSSASTARGSTTGVFELRGNSPVAGVSLADAPAATVSDRHSIWLAEPSAGEVVRIDLASRQIEQTISVDGSPSLLAVGAGLVWAATAQGDTIYRIDQTTQRVTDRIILGNHRVTALAYGFGRLWVGDSTDQELLAYNPATDRRAATIPIDVQPSALAAGAGGVWIADYDQGDVEEVDPRSATTVGTVRVGDGPIAIAVGDRAVWVANSLSNTVSRIDPASLTPGPEIPVGDTPVALAVNGHSVSVANEYASSVSRIDRGRNAVVQTTAIGGGPTAIAAAAGRIWVGTKALGAHRGGTLRLLFQRPLWVDMAEQEDLQPLQSNGLTNDALLAYDDHDGGLPRLVPDLAFSIPAPTDGGTTYTFRVRRVLYSNGRPVQPEDFRRAIERLFRVQSGWMTYYTDIVGAAACNEAQCDLSRGIVVNDAHRTITFRLTRPDPDFYYNMTSIATAPVPPGTPWHYLGFTPIPGTGPYMVKSADSHEIRYVRNPYFHQWSHAAQPDGNPDVITMRYGLSPTQEVRQIEQNKADWSADGIPGNLLHDVKTRFPSQWHTLAPVTETDWLQLNTTIPPFNDIRVRQALNLAIDRAAIVRMYGGRLTATPTCQILPPGLPGYRPYCPYTRRPGTGGHWRAPDLARARTLITASGTRDDQVTAYGRKGGGPACTTVIRYTARLLRELGYRAEAHIVPDGTPVDMSAAQIGCIGYQDIKPANFLAIFGCSSQANNDWSCDRRFDAELLRAKTLEQPDPHTASALFTKLDREATNLAIALPLVNQHLYDFVSARVKNTPEDPTFGLIVDQTSLR
jgi:peptide/nickel transport system substrate-binding protein